MGRGKGIDEADLLEVLSLRDDFGVLQKENTQVQSQVSQLQTDVHAICCKQGEISATVGEVEKVVIDLGKQLSVINGVLHIGQNDSAGSAFRSTC